MRNHTVKLKHRPDAMVVPAEGYTTEVQGVKSALVQVAKTWLAKKRRKRASPRKREGKKTPCIAMVHDAGSFSVLISSGVSVRVSGLLAR